MPGQSRSHIVALVIHRDALLRMYIEGREALCNRLIEDGMPDAQADQWCDAWDNEAVKRGVVVDADYWQVGVIWIIGERAMMKRL
jgi:hypothetical protein